MIWQSDFTYLETREGWLGLAFTLDACWRRCLAHCCREDMSAELTVVTFSRAAAFQRPSAGLIHHSDRRGGGGEERRTEGRASQRPIRLRRVPPTTAVARCHRQHEPIRQPLRQRLGGELRRHAENRMLWRSNPALQSCRQTHGLRVTSKASTTAAAATAPLATNHRTTSRELSSPRTKNLSLQPKPTNPKAQSAFSGKDHIAFTIMPH